MNGYLYPELIDKVRFVRPLMVHRGYTRVSWEVNVRLPSDDIGKRGDHPLSDGAAGMV
jgi:hypothetical protein